jgi:hypothetical protein
MTEVVRFWLLTTKPRVRLQVPLCEICDGRSGTKEGFPTSFFGFPLLIIIPPFLQAHLSPLPGMFDNPDHAVHYHILSIYIWGLFSNPAPCWLYSKEVSFVVYTEVIPDVTLNEKCYIHLALSHGYRATGTES